MFIQNFLFIFNFQLKLVNIEILFPQHLYPLQFSQFKIWCHWFFRLSRDMNNKRISCVAKNNEINDPKTRTVTVQMNRKNTSFINGHWRIGWFLVRPQSVKILRKETYLTEGQKVHIVCEVENNCNILDEISANVFPSYRPRAVSRPPRYGGISENLLRIILKSR